MSPRYLFAEQNKDAGIPRTTIIVPNREIPIRCTCTWGFRENAVAKLRYKHLACPEFSWHRRIEEPE